MDKIELPTESIPVKVTESSKKISYKTKIEFHDKDKGKRVEVSIQAPICTQSGCLQFLLEDRLVTYPMAVIFRWETEQLIQIEDPKSVI